METSSCGTAKTASLNRGGPKRTGASREKPNPSRGIIRALSALPLLFSSWSTAIAHDPTGTSVNVSLSALSAVTDICREAGSSLQSGNDLGMRVMQTRTSPLAERRPVISTWTLLNGPTVTGAACGLIGISAAPENVMAPIAHRRYGRGGPTRGNKARNCIDTARDGDGDGWRLSAMPPTGNE